MRFSEAPPRGLSGQHIFDVSFGEDRTRRYVVDSLGMLQSESPNGSMLTEDCLKLLKGGRLIDTSDVDDVSCFSLFSSDSWEDGCMCLYSDGHGARPVTLLEHDRKEMVRGDSVDERYFDPDMGDAFFRGRIGIPGRYSVKNIVEGYTRCFEKAPPQTVYSSHFDIENVVKEASDAIVRRVKRAVPEPRQSAETGERRIMEMLCMWWRRLLRECEKSWKEANAPIYISCAGGGASGAVFVVRACSISVLRPMGNLESRFVRAFRDAGSPFEVPHVSSMLAARNDVHRLISAASALAVMLPTCVAVVSSREWIRENAGEVSSAKRAILARVSEDQASASVARKFLAGIRSANCAEKLLHAIRDARADGILGLSESLRSTSSSHLAARTLQQVAFWKSSALASIVMLLAFDSDYTVADEACFCGT